MTRLYLLFSGVVAVAIGMMILLAPVVFYASYDIDVAGQVNLLNEMRSHGLALVGAGAFIGSGAVVLRLAPAATVTATGLYLAYGLSRMVAMALDGVPSSGLMLAAAFEGGLGLMGLALLLRGRSGALLTT